MGFFDLLADIPPYSETAPAVHRLNQRHRLLVAPFAGDLAGARVLDLAAHDGRWSYALAAAGAAEVVGIEGRGELVDRFASFPAAAFKDRVDLRQGEIFAALERFAAEGVRFDVVAVFGIFYHVMDHFRLLRLVQALGPRLVIVDSEFMRTRNPMIQLILERTDNPLNATAQVDGQELAIKGVPSFRAMQRMAEALGYAIAWTDPRQVFASGDRAGVQDYFRMTDMRRSTCALRPAG